MAELTLCEMGYEKTRENGMSAFTSTVRHGLCVPLFAQVLLMPNFWDHVSEAGLPCVWRSHLSVVTVCPALSLECVSPFLCSLSPSLLFQGSPDSVWQKALIPAAWGCRPLL